MEENSNTQRTPFLFTAKELDEETGLYYFGARYYDPRTSVWQSGDPILGDYLPNQLDKKQREKDWQPENNLKGMGGAFRSLNLAMYSYAHQSPIGNIDQKGTDTIGVGITVNIPTWLIKKTIDKDFIAQGASVGIAISFPGLFGGEWDFGGYVEGQAGGEDFGTGKGTADLTYNVGSVRDLGGSGAEFSFNDGIGGLSLSLDEKGNISGVGMHLGEGVHVSGGGTIGGTYTVRDAVNDVKSWFSGSSE